MHRLSAGVGPKQVNWHSDVWEVQRLLDAHLIATKRGGRVRLDGWFGPHTESAIRRFQEDVLAVHMPDGIVSPDGPTWRALTWRDGILRPRPSHNAHPAALHATPSPPAVAQAGGPSHAYVERSDDLMYLAKTLYGEAAGQSYASKVAVGWSIRNRLATGRWGRSYRSVVTAHMQYDCWAPSDPNYRRIQHPTGRAWEASLSAADEVTHAEERDNPIPRATHYYSPAAQAQEHQRLPKIFPALPPFARPPAEQVPNPTGVSDDDFRFYRNVH